MKKINIFINSQKFEGELNETKTAQRIYEIFPLEAKGNFWGNEIYFEVPLKLENENETEEVKVGSLAYWPDGDCLCIFYGKTPASTNGNPKPASPVTIVGKIKGDLQLLKKLKGARIKIEKNT